MKKIKYSKSSTDIKNEFKIFLNEDSNILKAQIESSKLLNKLPNRKNCILCGTKIEKSKFFMHRNSKYITCNNCGHTQSLSDASLLDKKKISNSFSKIYIPEDNKSYLSRRDRIYDPKLNWVLSELNYIPIIKKKLKNLKWLELGCGAGHFLSSLKKNGFRNYIGIDSNKDLIKTAQSKCGQNKAIKSDNFLDFIEKSDAEIYVSFFVLEHLDNPKSFWEMMRKKPKGTLFFFSVPTFSFSTLLESLFENYSARSLDNHVHTQLYSDKSIDYIIKKSGYSKRAEWLFGQDSMDLYRLLFINKNPKSPTSSMLNKTINLLDEIQIIFDKNRMCDSRHILIEKK